MREPGFLSENKKTKKKRENFASAHKEKECGKEHFAELQFDGGGGWAGRGGGGKQYQREMASFREGQTHSSKKKR